MPAAAQDCADDAKIQTEIGRVVQVGAILDAGNLNQKTFDHDVGELRYFRALLTVRAGPAAKWHLTIRDAFLRPIETFSATGTRPGANFWTRRLDGKSVVSFDLQADQGVEIELRQVIVMPDKAERPYYSLQKQGVYRFIPLADAETSRRKLGDSVGMLMSSWAGRSWCCSGVVVGENKLLTNWHCGSPDRTLPPESVWNDDICANTIIDMSWDGDAQDREYVCKKVLEKDEHKDYAILEITPRNGKDALRPPEVRAASVAANEQVIIVHHPACRTKQVSLSCNVVQSTHPGWRGQGTPDFTHNCDTEAGSSGAAVFDLQNRLVGIHHLQFEKRNGVCDKVNKGVRIEEIIKRTQ